MKTTKPIRRNPQGRLIVIFCITAWCVRILPAAEPGMRYDQPHADHDEQVFRANEFSVDLFASGSVGQQTIEHLSGNRVTQDGRIGGGIGGSYFFHRMVGVSVDAYTENTGHAFVDDLSGSLVVRFPFDAIRLAPYAFGGGGYQFDPVEQAFGHFGAGVEWRFHKNVGVFADARYVITDKTDNFGLGRLGLRFSF